MVDHWYFRLHRGYCMPQLVAVRSKTLVTRSLKWLDSHYKEMRHMAMEVVMMDLATASAVSEVAVEHTGVLR